MQRQRVARGAAGVVTDQRARVEAEVAHERSGVLGDRPRAVLPQLLRLRGEVVAPQIGGDDGVVARELLELAAEDEPALREPMEEDDQRPRAGADVVEADAVSVEEVVFEMHDLDRSSGPGVCLAGIGPHRPVRSDFR
jgi:hypothetical protein